MSEQPMHVYSEKYPPVKQARTELETIAIEVVDLDGKRRFDPTSASIAAQSGTLMEKLGRPGAQSAISGEPAYLYRNDVVEIPLTAEEIARLFAHSLEPDEFLALARTYGVFYEISSKFYDEDTGIALSPNYSHAQRLARDEVAGLPHLLAVYEAGQQKWHPHSIMSLDSSERICYDLACAGYNFRLIVLEPTSDSKKSDVDLIGNIVALHTLKDGSLRAYGPYDNGDDAEVPRYAALSAINVGYVPSTIC
jgi:hypothetical protein